MAGGALGVGLINIGALIIRIRFWGIRIYGFGVQYSIATRRKPHNGLGSF